MQIVIVLCGLNVRETSVDFEGGWYPFKPGRVDQGAQEATPPPQSPPQPARLPQRQLATCPSLTHPQTHTLKGPTQLGLQRPALGPVQMVLPAPL